MIRLALALVVTLAGCPAAPDPVPSGTESPAPDTRSPVPDTGSPMEFRATLLDGGNQQDWPAPQANGQEGSISVRGKLDAPTPCQNVTGTLARSGETLTVTVDVRATGDICAQMIATFGYEATIRELAPGSYQVRVIHRYPGTGWDTQTVLDERVTVR